MQVTVSSDSMILILTLIKKAITPRMIRVCSIVEGSLPILFTPQGFYVQVETIRFFVPVSLNIQKVFGISYYDLERLLRCDVKTDVSFSIHFNFSNGYVGGNCKVCYTESDVPRELQAAVYSITIDELFYRIPTETVKSITFLPALVKCTPFLSKEEELSDVHFCLDNKNIVAMDGVGMIVMHNIEMPLFEPFLLTAHVRSFLPKTGVCSLAFLVKETTDGKNCLYLHLSNYHVWIDDVAGFNRSYTKWKSIFDKKIVGGVNQVHQLNFDKRDRDAFLKRLDAMPKNSKYGKRYYDCNGGRGDVRFSIVEGRLCADSCSIEDPNIRFRFSEKTVGTIHVPTMVDSKYLKLILPFAVQVWQNKNKGAADALIFESESESESIMYAISTIIQKNTDYK
jgi:hypothetical protein